MARDDRERNFEAALSRSLRANRSAGAPAGRPAPPPPPQPPHDCPDAELLAAYHERLLTPEEMSFQEQHVASCPLCEEILAQLEATEEIPLELDHEAAPARSAVTVSHLQHVRAARASASPSALAAIAQFNFSVETPRRSANWRWLVPAGALAAGLLIWFAINKSTAPRAEFQLAKNQTQPAPQSAPVSPPLPTNSAKDKSAESTRQPPPAAKTDAFARSTATSLDEKGAREQRAPVPSPSGPPKTARGDGQSGGFVISPKQAQTQSRVPPQSPSESNELARDAAPPLGSPAPATSNSIAKSGTPTRSVPSENKKESVVSGTTGVAATEEARAYRGGVQPLRKAADLPSPRNPQLVSSPEGEVIWRLMPSGIVQRSADAGANWTLQKTGVVADLLAGSAPSANICWVAGRSGAILLTTNSGSRWLKVPSPTTDDITTIVAVDAQQATITTTTNKAYKTTNGGTTWTPPPSP